MATPLTWTCAWPVASVVPVPELLKRSWPLLLPKVTVVPATGSPAMSNTPAVAVVLLVVPMWMWVGFRVRVTVAGGPCSVSGAVALSEPSAAVIVSGPGLTAVIVAV